MTEHWFMDSEDLTVMDGAVDPWDATLLELGYINCRPCREWHRPPECAIDTEGFLAHVVRMPVVGRWIASFRLPAF